MSAARENQVLAFNAYDRGNRKQRIAVNGDTAAVLADVFREDVNIATWTRPLSPALLQSVGSVLAGNAPSEVAIIVSPTSVGPALDEVLPGAESRELANDIARLVDMFCSLLGVEKAGLRLSTLYQAMCPKFHVDRIPCRLITTYHGIATEWLPHQSVDRTKLGPGSFGKTDFDAGLYSSHEDVRRMACGDVAIMKGESWDGNAGAGLVHRSPDVPDGEQRLLLTLDVAD